MQKRNLRRSGKIPESGTVPPRLFPEKSTSYCRPDIGKIRPAALTELFESIKDPQTPIIVEKIVNDIDNQIVEIVRRFSDAFSTVSGRREVQQRLRSTLYIKYKIKDKEVFEKAYSYIEQYY